MFCLHYGGKWYIIFMIIQKTEMTVLKHIKELWELYASFFRMGALTFGGGYAMLPMIEREIVEKHKWATMEEVMDYYAIGQCTPGVIAVNVATFIGHKIKGILGGIVATIGVITPSVFLISIIASLLQTFYENSLVKAAFQGIGVAVCAILVQAVLKIGKAGLVDRFTWIVGVISFMTAWLFDISTIVIIVAAGVVGIAYRIICEKLSKDRGGEE